MINIFFYYEGTWVGYRPDPSTLMPISQDSAEPWLIDKNRACSELATQDYNILSRKLGQIFILIL